MDNSVLLCRLSITVPLSFFFVARIVNVDIFVVVVDDGGRWWCLTTRFLILTFFFVNFSDLHDIKQNTTKCNFSFFSSDKHFFYLFSLLFSFDSRIDMKRCMYSETECIMRFYINFSDMFFDRHKLDFFPFCRVYARVLCLYSCFFEFFLI